MSAEASPRLAVVTGAAGGIGQAIVREFTVAGYAVIATDRVAQPVDLPCSLYLHADLALTVDDEAYAAELFARIRSHLAGQGLEMCHQYCSRRYGFHERRLCCT